MLFGVSGLLLLLLLVVVTLLGECRWMNSRSWLIRGILFVVLCPVPF